MDAKIKEYRTKHKKCKWCKYYRTVERWVGVDYYLWGECVLKDKFINWEDLYNLCRYYVLDEKEKKEEKNDKEK